MARRVRIPSHFELLGCTWTVHVIPSAKWEDEESVGFCKPDTCQIFIRRTRRDLMEHTYLHECTHAILYAMGSKLYDKEEFVDSFSGLLHQIYKTAE